MYRFLLTPRWIAFHLLVIAAIVLMINLGFWQLRRLDERQAFNEAVSSRIDRPPEPITDVMTPAGDVVGLQWRAVEATGTYLPEEEFVVVNRSEGGVAGDLVVTPMRLDDGRILLVQRGFVPLAEAAAPAPSGEVDIVGRLREPQQRRRGQLSDPPTGELREVQRIDFERLNPQLPEPGLVPMWVELVASEPAEAGPFPVPVAAPELGEGPHLSYAMQWFIFAAAVAVAWVLAVRKSLNDRRTGSPGGGGASTTEAPAAQPTSS